MDVGRDARVLVIEDDELLGQSLQIGLSGAGYRPVIERDGASGLAAAQTREWDLIILDIMLPSMDGIQICRAIRRESQVPIIMLTAKAESVDVVVGLEVGADDYITKPFEMSELVARVHAMLRRAMGRGASETLRIGSIEIDVPGYRATKDGKSLPLTSTEFRLLLELARNGGKVLSRERLLTRVWNYDYMGDSRLVDMAVARLREKIEQDPRNPSLIVTVRGAGYKLETT
jgi:two-component system response regulator MtrA